MRTLTLLASVGSLLLGETRADAGMLLGTSSSSPAKIYEINPATGAASEILTLDANISFGGFEIVSGVGYVTDEYEPAPQGGNYFHFGRVDLT